MLGHYIVKGIKAHLQEIKDYDTVREEKGIYTPLARLSILQDELEAAILCLEDLESETLPLEV